MNYSASNGESPSQALARELGGNAKSDLGLALLRYVTRWEETQNPHWIDLAVVIVTEADQLIPPCLQVIASHIAKRRLNGMEAPSGGASAIAEEIKGQAFACMAFLIGSGMTVAIASIHAANATTAIFGSHKYKASSLEKEYNSRRQAEFGRWEELLKDAASREAGVIGLLMKHLEAIPKQDPGNRRL